MGQAREDPPGRFFLSRFVKGKPFSADVEIRRGQGGGNQQLENGKIYVDSTGRLRQEFMLDTPVASIWDPVEQHIGLIDLDSGKLLLSGPSPAESPTAPERTPPELTTSGGEFSGSEDLGGTEIEGLTCRGHRLRDTTTVYEVWWSTELGALVLWRQWREGGEEETVYRLSNVRRVEPDPGLFRLPVDSGSEESSSHIKRLWVLLQRGLGLG
jgi:hypothetical protein